MTIVKQRLPCIQSFLFVRHQPCSATLARLATQANIVLLLFLHLPSHHNVTTAIRYPLGLIIMIKRDLSFLLLPFPICKLLQVLMAAGITIGVSAGGEGQFCERAGVLKRTVTLVLGSGLPEDVVIVL